MRQNHMRSYREELIQCELPVLEGLMLALDVADCLTGLIASGEFWNIAKSHHFQRVALASLWPELG